MSKQIAEFDQAAELDHADVALLQQGAAGTPYTKVSLGQLLDFLQAAVSVGRYYKGGWDASANSPTIVGGSGAAAGGIVGAFFVVKVAGTTSIDGTSTWIVGDQIVWDGSAWSRVPLSAWMGSLATMDADNVAITGGSATGLAQVGTAFATTKTVVDYAHPASYWLDVDYDQNGLIAGTLNVDGSYGLGTAVITNLTSTQAALKTASVANLLISLGLTLGQAVTTPALSYFAPDYGLLSFEWDAAGNITSGLFADGTRRISKAQIDNLIAGSLSVLGVFAPASLSVGGLTSSGVPPYMIDVADTKSDPNGNIVQLTNTAGRNLIGVGDPAYAVENRAKASPMATVSVPISIGGAWGGNLATVGTTVASIWSLEAEFDWVRVIFMNDRVSNWGIQTLEVAATAAPGDYVTPSGGNANSWMPVTFNNGGLDKPYNAQNSGTTTSLLNLGSLFPPPIPTAVNNNTFSLVCSDWVNLRSIPRTDGGKFPLLLVRAYLTSVGGAQIRGVNLQNNSSNINGGGCGGRGLLDFIGGRKFVSYQAAGNFTAGNEAAFPAPNPGDTPGAFAAPCMVQIMLRTGRTVTIMNVGDSIHGGTGGFLSVSWIHKAVYGLSRPGALGFPIHLNNLAAWPGASPQDYLQNAMTMLPIVKPNILVTESWSRNDAPFSWAANTAYPIGSIIADSNGCIQQSGPLNHLPGTSGATSPTWSSTLGATTADGTITWTCISVSAVNRHPSTAYSVGNLALDSNLAVQRCTTAGTSSASTPTWATTLGATTTDGSVVWTLQTLVGSVYSQPGADQQYRQTMDLVNAAQQLGAVAVVVAPVPGLTQSAALQAAEPFRVSIRDRVLLAGKRGMVIMDAEGYLGQSTPTNVIYPNPMIPSLSLAGIGVHPNDFGYSLMARELTPKLAAMCGITWPLNPTG